MNNKFIHLAPLWIFTTVMIVAAGLSAALGAARVMGVVWESAPHTLYAICILIMAGGFFSLLHLGRKMRAPLALLGASRSWLSREILLWVLFCAFTLVILVCLLIDKMGLVPRIALYSSALTGLLLMGVMGMLYHVKTQPAWSGPAHVAAPLVSALLLAVCLLSIHVEGMGIAICFYGLWGLDFVGWLWRVRLIRCARRSMGAALFPWLHARVTGASVLRLLMGSGVLWIALESPDAWSLYLYTVCILLDRFCFYAGAVQITPASEMAKIRAGRMQAAAGPPDPDQSNQTVVNQTEP